MMQNTNRAVGTARDRSVLMRTIDTDVVIVGNTGYFEIWDAKRYDAVDDETDLGLLFD